MFSLGDRVQVWVDRVDRMQRRIQFALAEEEQPTRSPHRQKKKRGR